MKKTIAKIMAGVMLLSTVVAPDVMAAYFSDNANVSSLSQKDVVYISAGVSYAALSDENLNVLATGSGSTGNMTLYDEDGEKIENAWIGVEVTVNKSDIGEKGRIDTAHAVTSGSATTTVWESGDAAANILNTIYSNGSKVDVISNGKYQDVTIGRNVGADDWASVNLVINGTTVTPYFVFNRSYSGHNEIVRQLRAGNGIQINTRIYVNGVKTAFSQNIYYISLNNYNGQSDNYWNGIVKLKSSNNRYTPIRVHYDIESASVAGANQGLYVQVVNGTNVVWNGTNDMVTRAELSNQKVEIQDVQTDDLALLQSDIAKGKNLMLDKVYVFDITNARNNNSLNGAGAQYYDWWLLGQNNTLPTEEAGIVNTIHARLFKDCKEKLVQAENVKFINNGAFRKNKQLKKAIIGTERNIKKINEKSFYDCKKLATVKLSGKTLKRVGSGAFKNTKSNIIFKIKGNSKQVDSAWKKLKKQAPAKARHAKI